MYIYIYVIQVRGSTAPPPNGIPPLKPGSAGSSSTSSSTSTTVVVIAAVVVVVVVAVVVVCPITMLTPCHDHRGGGLAILDHIYIYIHT